ncbi:MAG: bile acid:sodium symporter [Akkermansiaceae bacterium]|jgi:sodium/bile acid cotransporter 7|nr:bile acid:sodium symporter [Akkermansiaceae bacterium]
MGETLDAWKQADSVAGVSELRQNGRFSGLWRKHGFLMGLVMAVMAGFVYPQGGGKEAWLPPVWVSQGGIALILLMQGLSLPLDEVRKGLASWKLHAVIQGFTFVVFPLAGWILDAALPALWPGIPTSLRHGFLYLCVLPSTISTSVVFTALARGNTAGALFNAALSNLAGVILTPVLVHLLMMQTMAGGGGEFGPLLGKISLLTLLPFAVGMLLRPMVREWVDGHKVWVGRISNAVILYIVYIAFCDSVTSGIWAKYGWRMMIPAVVLTCGLFGVMSLLVMAACRGLGLGRGDRIAAYFCGVKKTLAMGVPLAALIFGADADLSLILLPVMLYHPVQLLANGALAARWAADGK